MAFLARALWARSTKNPDVSTGPLGHPFACSLTPSTPSVRSLICSLAHFAHSLARGTVNNQMANWSVFSFSILNHSAEWRKWQRGRALPLSPFPIGPEFPLSLLFLACIKSCETKQKLKAKAQPIILYDRILGLIVKNKSTSCSAPR